MKISNPVFVTFYDETCIGVRTLMAITKQNNIKCSLVVFKTHGVGKIKSKEYGQNYEYYQNGKLVGSLMAFNPFTQKDVEVGVQLLKRLNPDLLCFSARTFGMPFAEWLARELKKQKFDVSILAGGWGPTLEPEKALEWADYVCFGEAEKMWQDVLDRGLDKNTKNLIYRINSHINRNPCHTPMTINELEELPFQNHDNNIQYLVDNEITHAVNWKRHTIYETFSGRGCPLSCSYCMSGMYRTIYKDFYDIHCPKYRLIPAKRIIEELCWAMGQWPTIRRIKLKDEVFPWDKKWLAEWIEQYPKVIGNIKFSGHLRPELHTEKTIKQLKQVGLLRTTVGIQSGSARMLKIYNRAFTLEMAKEFAHNLDKWNIGFSYHFISDCPFETEQDLINTLKLLWEMPYASLATHRLAIFPHTPIKKKIELENPQALSHYLHDWYNLLYCLAAIDKWRRPLSKVIWRLKIFRKHPSALKILFWFADIKKILKWILRK